MKPYILALALLLLAAPALATHPAPSPTPSSTSQSGAVAAAGAKAGSKSSSAAHATGGKATSTAKGGNASADSANVNTNGQGQQQSANNEGNAQVVQTNVERSAPAAVQGGLAISGCAAGGNAGGSNTNGAAFLGVAFTPAECYAFMLAQAYAAVNQPQAACQVLNTTRAAQRAAKHGVKLPSCETEVIIRGAPDDLVTREELAEHEKRIVRGVTGK